ncbi:Dihydroxy-acid dehydratase [Nymphaea thermarum]|nr:Dihydroxy-acid dehydratase [Nymphaea thermarum]
MTAAACLTSSFTVTPTTQHRHHHLCRPHSLSIRASSSPVAPPPQWSYTPPSPAENLNKYSSRIAQPKSQGGSQAFLYGVGHSDDDMNKPQAGRAPVWYEGKTCNIHLLQLAEAVKEGLREAAIRFQHRLRERRHFYGD